MVPGSIGLIGGVSCLILLASGWGTKLCRELMLSPKILSSYLIAFILGSSIRIPGPLHMQVSFSGFLVPLAICFWMLYLSRPWTKTIYIVLKGCIVAVVGMFFTIWVAKGTEVVVWQLAYGSESLLVCLTILLIKSWQGRFTIVWLATLALQVFTDIWIRHVPFEYFVFGNGLSKDMLLIGSVQLCLSFLGRILYQRYRNLNTILSADKTSNRT